MDWVSPEIGELEARVRQLEQAKAELQAVNLRLARGRLGASEAAAASVQSRMRGLREEIALLQQTVQARERRIEEITQIAADNDSLYQIQLAWNDAKRYRVADCVVELIGRFAVLRALVRAGRWLDAHVGR
jgi:chromosome segregation ATPase